MSLGLFTSRQLQRVLRPSFTIHIALKHNHAGARLLQTPKSTIRNQRHSEPSGTTNVSETPAPRLSVQEENLDVTDDHLANSVLKTPHRFSEVVEKTAYGNNLNEQFCINLERDYAGANPVTVQPSNRLTLSNTVNERKVSLSQLDAETGSVDAKGKTSPNIAKHRPKLPFNKYEERLWNTISQRLDRLHPERFLPNRPYFYPDGYTIVHDYITLRKLGAVKYLLSHHYVILAKEIAYRRLSMYLVWLVQDLLAFFPRQADSCGFVKAATTIMSLGHTDCPLLPSILLKLYNEVIILKPTEPLPLPNAAWVGIYQAALMYPDDCCFTLESLVDAFFATQRAAGRFTFALINLANKILIELLLRGQEFQSETLGVFRKLVEHGLVPNIQDDIDADDASFKMVILRSMIRGYMATGIYFKAFEHIELLLRDPRWVAGFDTTEADRVMTASLAIEVINATLLRPWKQEVAACRRVITMLTLKSSQAENYCITTDVPDSTVLGFYDACRYFNLPIEAASVYVHLRSPEIHQRHHYLPPRGTALVWLLDYFADPNVTKSSHTEPQSFRGRIDMAKAILQDIIDLKTDVPVNDRPRILAIAALRGFASEARVLYDLWADERNPDYLMVQGSAKMLVPLVKLFIHLQENWDRDAVAGRPEEHRQGQDDAWLFATRVVDGYMQAKNPIQQASQMDLNALARALVELDRIVEAFAVLHIVVRRLDIPDIKDINVALLAIARYSVPRAVWTLEYMLTKGITPTASTFSALIHMAVRKNQRYLIPQLLERAGSLDLGELTPKGVATLVHAELRQPEPKSKEDEDIHQARNQLIWDLVQTVINFPAVAGRRSDHSKDHVLSVRMGFRYVKRALALKDGRLAMEFWRALLKERTCWWDKNAVRLREDISKAVKLQGSAGHLREGEAKELLKELDWARDGVT